MDPRFNQKIEIFEIQNFNKIPSFTIFFFIFLAFLTLCLLFHVPKLVPKLWNFLWCFIGRVEDFTNNFWKILKVLLKKILICEIFLFKILWFNICFFIFLLFLTFYFEFRLSVLVKKFLKILSFFILWIRDFIIKFWIIMECFSKKYRHLKSKILHKFHCLLFIFFYSFSILIIFFSYFIYPNFIKNSIHFCGALLYGL